jgi:hypothetical protein
MKAVKFISGYAAVRKSSHTLAIGETNDCVVRAFMNATESSYDEAHRFIAATFNRKPKQGTRAFAPTMQKLAQAGTTLPLNAKRLEFLGKHPELVGADSARPEQAESLQILINPKYPKGEGRFAGYTVGKFYQQHPTGTYILQVRNHALCIRDGVIYDNLEYNDHLLKTAARDQRKVQYAFRVV